MILKHIYLNLNTAEFPDALVTAFGFQTRYICNFIERRLKGERFKAEDFSKICVQGRETPSKDCRIVSENALVSEVRFDRERYETLDDSAYHEFFLAMLEEGLRNCEPSYTIPLDVLISAIDEFRRCGYVNQWEHKKKRLAQGLVAELRCELNMSEFILTLSIHRRDEVVFEKAILRTKPDEIIFAHQFKDIRQSDDELIVTNKFGKTLYAMQISDFATA